MSSARLDSLRLHLLPGRPHPGREATHDAAYRLWREVWSQTFAELDGSPLVFADDFTRTDEIVAIFSGDRCVTLAFAREGDLRLASTREDSYFKPWPEIARQRLGQDGPRILFGSNITVDPEWRGEIAPGVTMKDLVIGSSMYLLRESGRDVMTGTMRCNRGMDAAARRFGARSLQAKTMHHGVEVELVGFFSKSLQFDCTPEFMRRLDQLWDRRVIETRAFERGLKAA